MRYPTNCQAVCSDQSHNLSSEVTQSSCSDGGNVRTPVRAPSVADVFTDDPISYYGAVLVVICGAGASYGCIPNRDITPPLTRTLFHEAWSEFLEPYGTAAPLIGPIRRKVASGGDIEQVLDSYQQVGDSTTSRQLAAITCYIRDVIYTTAYRTYRATAGVDFYAELVNRLRLWRERTGERVGYVTFNYDDLLDRAWSNVFGQDVRTVDALVNVRAAAPVFHPHGSVHWCRPIFNPGVLKDGIEADDVLRKFELLSLGDLTFVNCQSGQLPGPESVSPTLLK